MERIETTNSVSFIVAMLGVLFAIYRYFRDPDESADKRIDMLAQRIDSAQMAVDKRFKDMQENFDKMNVVIHEQLTSNTHKFEAINNTQVSMGKELVKIATILEERLPSKK